MSGDGFPVALCPRCRDDDPCDDHALDCLTGRGRPLGAVKIGDRWLEGGVWYVETERGPDVFRGTCDAEGCTLPACWMDAGEGVRACYSHTLRQAILGREFRAALPGSLGLAFVVVLFLVA